MTTHSSFLLILSAMVAPGTLPAPVSEDIVIIAKLINSCRNFIILSIILQNALDVMAGKR